MTTIKEHVEPKAAKIAGLREILLEEPISIGGLRILHISDLHFKLIGLTKDGREANGTIGTVQPSEFLRRFSDSLKTLRGSPGNQSKFDVVVFTGDLVDSPAKDSTLNCLALKTAIGVLENICFQVAGHPKNHLFIVPGNHDLRISGLFTCANARPDFELICASYIQNAVIPQLGLFITCFDSNGVQEKLGLATGYIHPDQFSINSQQIRQYCERNPQARHFRKLALLHHHPLPVAEAEIKRVSFLERASRLWLIGNPSALILQNAGIIIKKLIEDGFQLALHGHLHKHDYWRSATTPATNQHIEIIGAQALEGGTQKCAFNIIELSSDDQLSARQMEFDHSGVPGRVTDIVSVAEEVARDKIYARQLLRRQINATCRHVLNRIVVEYPPGHLSSQQTYFGLAPLEGAGELVSLPIMSVSSAMLLEPGLRARVVSPTGVHSRIVSSPKPGSSGERNRDVEFTPPIRDPATVVCERLAKGAMFSSLQVKNAVLGEANKDRKFRPKENAEETITHLVKFAYDFLTLEVGFVDARFLPSNFYVQVTDPVRKQRVLVEETSSNVSLCITPPLTDEQKELRLAKKSQYNVSLTVARPIVGYEYSIAWPLLQREPEYTKSWNNALRQLKRTTNERRAIVQAFIRKSIEAICQSVTDDPSRISDLARNIVGAVFVLDRDKRYWKLECVTAWPESDPIGNVSPTFGDWPIGDCLRTGERISYSKEANSDSAGIPHVPPPDSLPPDCNAVYCHPLFPIDSDGRCVGVLVLVTRKADSAIHGLADIVSIDDLEKKLNDLWLSLVDRLSENVRV